MNTLPNDILDKIDDFKVGDASYWKKKRFIRVLDDIVVSFGGNFMAGYVFDGHEINLHNMLCRIYGYGAPYFRTDLRFKNIKLHNILEYIKDSLILSDADKQYVIYVIKNEIKADSGCIIKCRKCQRFMNLRNRILPRCTCY